MVFVIYNKKHIAESVDLTIENPDTNMVLIIHRIFLWNTKFWMGRWLFDPQDP